MFTILVLGGYGNFGSRIARSLAANPDIHLLIAGRNQAKAAEFCHSVRHEFAQASLLPMPVDQNDGKLEYTIKSSGANLVIHSSGPYQGMDYRVPLACISAGCHYLDLADGREFVCSIGQLDAQARAAGVVVISGASTLPALSSAVIEALKVHFGTLESIAESIAPGQRTRRGLATLQGVLSYCGKSFRAWEEGTWTRAFGWQQPRWYRYPDLGRRMLLRCNVPDLELFPRLFSPVRSVRFDAALELPASQLGFLLLSWMTRIGMVNDPGRLAPVLLFLARMLDMFGSDNGGMHLELSGTDNAGKPLRSTWHLTARNGCGPEIPTLPAIMLARKLANDHLRFRGASPCTGFITLDEFMEEFRAMPITTDIRMTHP